MSAPERIYLQDAGDYSKAAALEVTWCVEPQDDGDTEYIRADAVAEMIRRAVLALEESNLQITYLHERLGAITGSGISVMARNEATIAALQAIRARGDA